MSLNFSALASAVILKAYEDLTGPEVQTQGGWKSGAVGKQFRRRERWREDAKDFLTSPNEDLKLWCALGGLNMNAIVEKSNLKLKEMKDEASRNNEVPILLVPTDE